MKKPFILILVALSILFGSVIFVRNKIQTEGIPSPRVAIKCIPKFIPPFKTTSFQIDEMPKQSSVLVTIMILNGKCSKFRALLNSDGFLAEEDGTTINWISNYGYGEPMFLKIQPCDPISRNVLGGNYGSTIFAPHPLEVSDTKGHHIEALCKNIEGTEFILQFSGFKPHEILVFNSRSCHEEMNSTISMDENGEGGLIYLPGVINETEGPFRVRFYNETVDLSLQHYWGKIAFTPLEDCTRLKDKFPDFFNINCRDNEIQKKSSRFLIKNSLPSFSYRLHKV